MRRRLPSWVAASLILTASLAHPPRACRGDVLDPNAFASQGDLNGGSVVINSGDGTTAPVILDGFGGSVVATGVISNGVAVFDFTSVSLVGSNFAVGLLPIAILSRGDMTISNLQETTLLGVPEGYPGGGQFRTGPFGGGGMGGPPGGGNLNDDPGSEGGAGASNLVHSLFGGNTGSYSIPSPANHPPFGQVPGAGGAAFEFVALGALTVGDIDAFGSAGAGAFLFHYGGQGGGGGGGVLLQGNAVSIVGTVDASGGQGGGGGAFGGSGGGGNGGEIDIFYGPGGFTNTGSLLADAGAGGGSSSMNGGPGGSAGIAGAIHISAVPEPSALALLALGAAVACGKGWRKATMARP